MTPSRFATWRRRPSAAWWTISWPARPLHPPRAGERRHRGAASVSYLVDTNIISEMVRPRPAAAVLAWMRAHEVDLYLSAITVGDLCRGIELLPRGKKRGWLEEWLQGVVRRMDGCILSFNASTAQGWAQAKARWQRAGLTVPSLDRQIAATALRHGLTLVTRNV